MVQKSDFAIGYSFAIASIDNPRNKMSTNNFQIPPLPNFSFPAFSPGFSLPMLQLNRNWSVLSPSNALIVADGAVLSQPLRLLKDNNQEI